MANFNCVGGRFFFSWNWQQMAWYRIVVVSFRIMFVRVGDFVACKNVICLVSLQPNLRLRLLYFGAQAGANVNVIFVGVQIEIIIK